jgi:hypothetical protein
MILVGGAVVSTACALVIDPDELVADNGTPGPDASSAADVPVAVGDAGDGSLDAATDGGPPLVVGCRNSPTGSIPACVPPPPAGADLLAVVWGRAGTALACPSGYVSPAALQGYADIEKAPPPCSATGCACGQTGAPSCVGRVQYYSDNACAVPSTSDTLASNACARTDKSSVGSANLVFSVTGVTCGASGTSPTKIDPATFCTEMRACRPDPNVARPACPQGQLATSTATHARLCYRGTGACAAPYVAVPGFATSSTINDTRACGCACDVVDGGTCTGGSVDRWATSNGCQNGATDTLGPACAARTSFQQSVRQATNATPSDAGLCAPRAQLNGALALPPADIALCCLPE